MAKNPGGDDRDRLARPIYRRERGHGVAVAWPRRHGPAPGDVAGDGRQESPHGARGVERGRGRLESRPAERTGPGIRVVTSRDSALPVSQPAERRIPAKE